MALLVPIGPLLPKLLKAKVMFVSEPLLVTVPEPAALPSTMLAFRKVRVPVVEPIEIDVADCKAVTVVAVLLNSPIVAWLVEMTDEFRLTLVPLIVTPAIPPLMLVPRCRWLNQSS